MEVSSKNNEARDTAPKGRVIASLAVMGVAAAALFAPPVSRESQNEIRVQVCDLDYNGNGPAIVVIEKSSSEQAVKQGDVSYNLEECRP